MNTALNTSAFESNIEWTLRSCLDLFGHLLRGCTTRDEHSSDTGHELLGKVQAVLEEIRDDDGLSTCCARREKGYETNGARTATKQSII